MGNQKNAMRRKPKKTNATVVRKPPAAKKTKATVVRKATAKKTVAAKKTAAEAYTDETHKWVPYPRYTPVGHTKKQTTAIMNKLGMAEEMITNATKFMKK